MASRNPWMYALGPTDRKECARDHVDAARPPRCRPGNRCIEIGRRRRCGNITGAIVV
jgi:hypothetical protein